MVCLNDKIPVNIFQMKKVIIDKLDQIIEDELFYIDDKNLNQDIKDKLKNNILKEMKNKLYTDNFIYLIMDNNYCSFKHNRGKNDGKFCCKRITSNGDKKEYLCTIHNKNHIPKTKNIKMKIQKIYKNNETLEKLEKIETVKNVKDGNNNYIYIKNQNIKNALKIKNKSKIHKNIHINNFNINIFRNISYNDNNNNHYKNIVCNYKEKELCHNFINFGCCRYKHIEKEILFKTLFKKENIDIFNNFTPVLSF